MSELTRREEQVLLAIWELKESAYLLSIKEYLDKITSEDWSVGIIHKPLLQLERKGFVSSSMGKATAKRGGRRKKMYEITRKGIEELKALKKENEILWENFLSVEIR